MEGIAGTELVGKVAISHWHSFQLLLASILCYPCKDGIIVENFQNGQGVVPKAQSRLLYGAKLCRNVIVFYFMAKR